MGHRLQRAALTFPGLTAHERLALTAYSAQALDTGTPPLAFCGWEYVAAALGRNQVTLEDARLLSRNDARAVERVTASLIRKGAMVRVEKGYRGHRAEYDLSPLIPYMPGR